MGETLGRVNEFCVFLRILFLLLMQMKSDLDHAALFFYKKKSWNEHIFLVPGGDIWMIFSWMHTCIWHYLGLRWLEQVSYFIHIFRQITFCYFQNKRVFEVHSSKIEYSICNLPKARQGWVWTTLLVKCPEDSKIQNLGGTVN